MYDSRDLVELGSVGRQAVRCRCVETTPVRSQLSVYHRSSHVSCFNGVRKSCSMVGLSELDNVHRDRQLIQRLSSMDPEGQDEHCFPLIQIVMFPLIAASPSFQHAA